MKSWLRMFLSFFALALVLFGIAYLFSPQVRTAMATQKGQSAIGQIKPNSEYRSTGQTLPPPTEVVSPEQSARGEGSDSGTQSGSTSR